ncbi:MAG: HAMP domain-containing sensor histidine kinase [Gemmatimonadota bacterium]
MSKSGAAADLSRPRAGAAGAADPPPRSGVETAIRAAAERLTASLPGREDIPPCPDTTPEELLTVVVEDLLDRLAGGQGIRLRDPEEASPRLRLLQLLQSELIHVWRRLTTRPPTRDEMLRVLSELDQTIVSLEPHGRDRVEAMVEAESPLTMVIQLAHDIRSPLTSVLFLAELLQRGRSGPVNETQQRQLGVIYSAAFALVSVANDVIELARGGGTSLTSEDPAPFSLAECLGTIREMLQPMAEDKGIEFRVVTPRDDRRVGHQAAIGRALLNLTTNALKFTEEGYVELAAEVTGWEHIRFSVTDTGRGMSPEAERNLFQPFQKSERRKGVFFSGSGLGLSIVQRIVRDLGGSLTYETEPHRGTRFEFTVRMPSVSDL